MGEGAPNQENPLLDFESLLALVQSTERSLDNPDVRGAFRRWEDFEITEFERNTPGHSQPIDRITFEYRKARIYFHGGYAGEAIIALREAAVMAHQEGLTKDRDEFEDRILALGGTPVDWDNPFKDIY